MGGRLCEWRRRPPDRPRRHPPDDRCRARGQQPRRVLLRSRGARRAAARAGRVQGRQRRGGQAGGALPRLRARRGRSPRPRAHGGGGGHHLARVRRQHEGGLVRLLHAVRPAQRAEGGSAERERPQTQSPDRLPGREERARRRRPPGLARRRDVPRRRRRSRGAHDRRGRAPGRPSRPRSCLLAREPSAHHLLRGQRLDGRRLRRTSPRDRQHRRPHDRGRSGLGARHASELRAGDGHRPRHAPRRGALDVRRVGTARRRRDELRRRRLPDLRPHDRDAVGQRGLLPEQRLRKQGGLAHGRERRAARRPGRGFLPPRAVRAVPQSGLSHLATRRRPGHVRRPRQHPAAGRAPVAHRHAAPVPASRRLGGRPLRGRPRQRVRGSAGLRAPDGAGADARSRSRVTRVVPGRRVPPRDRGAVDAAHRVHVGAPVAAARALDRAGDRVGRRPSRGTSSSPSTGRCRDPLPAT